MKIVVTMAGGGSRFLAKGLLLPKFMLRARGRTLFSWSMESLRNFFAYDFLFVTLTSHKSDAFILAECESLGISSVTICAIDALTDGQASTVIAGEAFIDPDEAIVVYNIDTYVEPSHLLPQSIRGDGWLPCFEGKGDHFSFVKMDGVGAVEQIAEKVRISDYATIGLYYFRSFRLFKDCYLESGFAGLKEKYVAPLYSKLLLKGNSVYASLIPFDCVHVLGTPDEVADFDPLFLKINKAEIC